MERISNERVTYKSPIQIGEILYFAGSWDVYPVRLRSIKIYAEYDVYVFEWADEDRWDTIEIGTNSPWSGIFDTYEEVEQERKRVAEIRKKREHSQR